VKETTVCEPKALSISSTMGKVYLETEIMIKKLSKPINDTDDLKRFVSGEINPNTFSGIKDDVISLEKKKNKENEDIVRVVLKQTIPMNQYILSGSFLNVLTYIAKEKDIYHVLYTSSR